MTWTWDDAKEARNRREHGFSFRTALLVFDDEHVISVPDPHSDDDRWRTIGMVADATLFVVHTTIEDDGSGRIISARRATPTERRIYERLRFQRHHA